MPTFDKNRALPRIVGIAGEAGVGKDTLANALHRRFPFVRRYAFAWPIKKMIDVLLGRPVSYKPLRAPHPTWENSEWKQDPNPGLGGATPRVAAQKLGTEWRDMVSTDLWLRCADGALAELAPHETLVISDVRFAHEMEWVRRGKGIILRLTRENGAAAGLKPEWRSHSSENVPFPDADDIVLENNGTVSQLITEAEARLAVKNTARIRGQ